MIQEKNIFYSWQSDLPETRNLISDALKQCVRKLNNSEDMVEALASGWLDPSPMPQWNRTTEVLGAPTYGADAL